MSFYRHHVFFCTNQRADGRKCCQDANATGLLAYAKDKAKALRLNGPGKARINASGCMDRCTKGPVIAVYPEAVWYSYANEADIDEIITSHLGRGEIVERLRLPERKQADINAETASE